MALRGSAARRTPDNPLAGVLRDLDRRTRSMEHQPKTSPEPGPPGPPGEPGPEGPPGPAPAATVVVTDHDGYAAWTLSPPMSAPPIISAVAVAQERGEDGPLTVTAVEVTAASVTVRVWRTRPVLGLGLLPAVPAAGVHVHLTATPAAPPDDTAGES
ncbi:hypothetical protein ACIQZB_00160 [Streptomyces sp. NPDC097727]|uniref:hypothetical protein n=1 Tax=Streptomyces sp. NPDC097727 TaxID=3366092 RepID=UPI0038236E24